MDLTKGTEKEKQDRSKKMLLWFGIASLIMGFAGWTSAYIVSSARKDWLDIELPSLFYVSTAVIILSSVTYWLAKKQLKQNKLELSRILLWITLGLGFAFIYLQFKGFEQMLGNGYRFTGPTSSIKMSFVYLIAAVHIVHVVAGIISLLVVLFKHSKGKYNIEDHLGFTLGETFWHFLGLLWLYLILFMTFVK